MGAFPKKIINYLLTSAIFCGSLTFHKFFSFADLRIADLILVFVLLLWILFLKSLYFNKTFLILFIIIIILSLCNVFLGKDTLVLLTKQIVGISISSLAFYLLIKINDYDVKKLFKIYLNFAFLVGLIGLFQELSYLLDFKMGYDFSYIFPSWELYLTRAGFLKINSIMSEPAVFCHVMIPAFFTALTTFSKRSFKFMGMWKSTIIILSFFLSFSLVGYIGIGVSLFLLVYNYGKIRNIVTGIVLIIVFIFFTYTNINTIKMRIDDSIGVLRGEMSLEKANLSTFTLFSNALVAYESFKDNPVFGSGLGSHNVSYSRYIGKVVDMDRVIIFLNMEDANSLFLRLLSETGLFGLLLIFYFIFKFHVLKKKDEKGYLWIISNAILVMFLMGLARSGHYFVGGFFFFFWIYYFSGKHSTILRDSY
jgi:O-antigen ligase